ncbi:MULTISPECIES: acyl carrier protein [unclassified Nonomuraea]|uniref:acyl carrier protein n=1 Tax=unclassified Nonomuraea TaxID=2593643 RepID=UPI0033ECE3EA
MTQADAVASLVERRLGRALDPDLNFFEAGFDSLALVELHEEITGALGLKLPVTAMFTHPNLRALSHLIAKGQTPAPAARQDGARRRPLGGSRRDVRARIREEGR